MSEDHDEERTLAGLDDLLPQSSFGQRGKRDAVLDGLYKAGGNIAQPEFAKSR